MIKRLSCFEEICPSELDRTEDEDQNDQDLMLPMTPISQLIFMEAAQNDEALEQQSPATGSKTAGASMSSQPAAAGFISTFAEMAQKSESQRLLLRSQNGGEEADSQPHLVQTNYRNRKGKNRKFRKVASGTVVSK